MVWKHFKWVLAVVLVFSSGHFVLPQASANSINQQIRDAKNKQEQFENERSSIQSEIDAKESEISQIKAEQQKLNKEIKRLDIAASETKVEIRETEVSIKETEAEIAKLNQEIEELKKRIAERDDMLKTRVRSVQQNGAVVNYIDVLLGSKSFGDFLDRVNAVSVIVQQDKDILQNHIEEKQLVEEKKQKVTDMLVQLENQLAGLEKLNTQLQEQRKQKDQIMAQLKQQENQIEEEMLEKAEEEEILAKQEAHMEKLIKQLQEKKRQQEEAKKRGESPPITDGNFMRPTNGPVTSNYGHRWGKLHAGIDIGKRGANVPVVSAADGIVFRSYYSSSYGNVVFIMHNINGQLYTTVYAHLENREVSEGQAVTKGQRLGFMGNTGRSFGAHLHFEIHKGEWNASKSNSVDPRKYINF